MVDTEDSISELCGLINVQREWLLVRASGRTFPLRSEEIQLERNNDRIIIGFLDNDGSHHWRLNHFKECEGGLELDVSGRFGKNREKIKFVPRTSSSEFIGELLLARLERANEIAAMLEIVRPGTKVGSVKLAKYNGRLAHIFIRTALSEHIAVLADVTDSVTAETLLTTAIAWLARLESREKNPIDKLWIVAEKRPATDLQKLVALLKERFRRSIVIHQVVRKGGADTRLRELPIKRTIDLWREKSKKLVLPEDPQPSKMAERIRAIAPEKIDTIFTRHGETIRFAGLPFARVRTVSGRERSWYGVDRQSRELIEGTWNGVTDLVEQLAAERSGNAANKRHDHYRLAPESWLESILLRNIKALDANLILAPIYNQFRASNDKIDLLAIRRDGRLVIIELKTSPDRQVVYQAVDYWRKIELRRRSGQLKEAKIFGEREILDKPALVYLVGPGLGFHQDVEFFARSIETDIEVWRFDLHENWRNVIKVIGRRNYSDDSGGLTNL
ncbi:MAG: hypothetical protein WBD22_10905 [Pyrinomonadaceae bacterium]